VIGIAGDRKLEEVEGSVRGLGLTFPQHWTGYWRENKVARDFGIPMVPYVAVIGPDATVLFVGHPSKLGAEVDKALVAHPPKVAEEGDVAKGNAQVDRGRAALEGGDVLGAFRAYAAVPPTAMKDPVVSKPAGELRSKLLHAAVKGLEEADGLVKDGKNVEAAQGLKAMIQTLGTMTGSEEAKMRLEGLMARPEVRMEVQRAERELAGAEALAEARRLRDGGNDESAYQRFKAIVMDYAQTPAAGEAAAAVKVYEGDAALQRKLRESAAGPKALAALNLAENYAKSGRAAQARAKYREVTEQWPETKYADAAKKALEHLPQ
jgi:hypothetical protein